jgi:hypothetical protein
VLSAQGIPRLQKKLAAFRIHMQRIKAISNYLLKTGLYGFVEASATRDTTALVYSRITAGFYKVLYRLTRVRRTGLTVSRGVDSSPQIRVLCGIVYEF